MHKEESNEETKRILGKKYRLSFVCFYWNDLHLLRRGLHIAELSFGEQMWIIETNSPRVPWEENGFSKREDFENYLKYFGIENYNGPGTYISGKDGTEVTITYLEGRK